MPTSDAAIAGDELAEAAKRSYQIAREHKRLSGHHRRRAQAAMAHYRELAAKCEELGINVTINTGGKSHG